VGQEVAGLNLPESLLDELREFLPLLLGDPSLEVLDLGYSLANESDQGYIFNPKATRATSSIPLTQE
jgi:hypothetical protein